MNTTAEKSTETEPAPKAFTGNDSSVYLSQAMAVADLIATGDHDQCAKGTVNEAGMLVFMLLDAANELAGIERDEWRARAGKLPEVQS